MADISKEGRIQLALQAYKKGRIYQLQRQPKPMMCLHQP
jgi:hypothetical protein